ncbi:MAG: hypothetical protein QG594_2188 [Bacteroidota bacterium]|nr:hypothetical protein [Bacteroidota bacterium]
METIRLEFQPNMKIKILELLSSFSSDELKIIHEDAEFEKTKKMLQSRIDKSSAKFYTIEEADAILEETISKYEKNKTKLDFAYAKLKSGTEKMFSVEEFEAALDEKFSKYDH